VSGADLKHGTRREIVREMIVSEMIVDVGVRCHGMIVSERVSE
jgi:hypothetical protein